MAGRHIAAWLPCFERLISQTLHPPLLSKCIAGLSLGARKSLGLLSHCGPSWIIANGNRALQIDMSPLWWFGYTCFLLLSPWRAAAAILDKSAQRCSVGLDVDEAVPSSIFGHGAWWFSCRLWLAWLWLGDKVGTWGRCLDDIVPPQVPPTCLWNPFQTQWDTPQCETQTSDSEGSRDYGGQRAALRGSSSERGCNEVHVKSRLLQMRELLDATQPRRPAHTYKYSRCYHCSKTWLLFGPLWEYKAFLKVAGLSWFSNSF